MTLRAPSGAAYRAARRRVLIDMHIPDWDPGFLGQYAPDAVLDAVVRTGADAVMIYFQSHIGLCYYPTGIGRRHAKALDRDLAGELLDLAKHAGLATCAYYSVNFNNQAWLDHPDWRLQPAAPASIGALPRQRYGIVCLNNAAQRVFVRGQLQEIARYPVDAVFLDMMWWNGVCTCSSCRDRFAGETGRAVPEVVDWRDPDWNLFQDRRRTWLAQWSAELADLVHSETPEVVCYHNFALGLANWTRGTSEELADTADFLGGDFYGSPHEQLLMTRLMQQATRSKPAEFMTTVSAGLTEHVALRSRAEMRRKALAAAHADQAFLAILAIDPAGTLDPLAAERCGDAFSAMSRLSRIELGDPYAEVAVYYCDAARMDQTKGETPLHNTPAASTPDYPHYRALAGAVAKLQRSHVSFTVISRRQIDRLDTWPVVVLPNAEALSDSETAAIRAYVEQGGKVYCSAASGLRPDGEWPLAEWLGIVPSSEPTGALHYLAMPGERPLAHRTAPGSAAGLRRFRMNTPCEVLATVTLPYGYPSEGSVEAGGFASIHSSPPWQSLEEPAVIRRTVRSGEVIYSGADIEAGSSLAHGEVFSLLISRLRGSEGLQLRSHPDVWLSAYRGETKAHVLLLHYPSSDPALAIEGSSLRLGKFGPARTARIVDCDGRGAQDLQMPGHDEAIALPRFSESLTIEFELA